MKRLFRCFQKDNDSGASAVELAIILPVLLALLLGIIEFGWIFTGYIGVTGAAREGARFAARGEEEDVIQTRVENHASTFTDIQGGSIDEIILPSGYPNSIPVGGEIDLIVKATLPLLVKFIGGENSFIPFPAIGDGNSISLSAKATMRREY